MGRKHLKCVMDSLLTSPATKGAADKENALQAEANAGPRDDAGFVQKKVRKRRKSIGPAAGPVPATAAVDEAELQDARAEVDRLTFELENAHEDNEILQETVDRLRVELQQSESARAGLAQELDGLRATAGGNAAASRSAERSCAGTTDSMAALGLSSRVCGDGPLGLAAKPAVVQVCSPRPSWQVQLCVQEVVCSGMTEAVCPGLANPHPCGTWPPAQGSAAGECSPMLVASVSVDAAEHVSAHDDEAEMVAANACSAGVSPPVAFENMHGHVNVPPPPPWTPPASSPLPPSPKVHPEGGGSSAAPARRRSRRKSVVSKELVRGATRHVNEASPTALDECEISTAHKDDSASALQRAPNEVCSPHSLPDMKQSVALSTAEDVRDMLKIALPATSSVDNCTESADRAVVLVAQSGHCLPCDGELGQIADPSALLQVALSMACAAYQSSKECHSELDEETSKTLIEARSLVGEIVNEMGDIAMRVQQLQPPRKKPQTGRSKKGGGSGRGTAAPTGRSVKFAAYDLSCLAPPKVQSPGSELEQEELIGKLTGLIRLQLSVCNVTNEERVKAVCESSSKAEGAGHGTHAHFAVGGHPGGLLRELCCALQTLHGSDKLASELRPAASFYAREVLQWLTFGARAPMLSRRLGELLSSSLRFHLAAIFSEEEDTKEPDPLLAVLHQRVREHAFAYGLGNVGGEESFSSVISGCLLIMHRHAGLLEAGSTTRLALEAAAIVPTDDGSSAGALTEHCRKAVTDISELSPETKDAILEWSHAQSVLCQILGPHEPLGQIRTASANRLHFARLSALAETVHSVSQLVDLDEAYFAPLRDMDELVRKLHTEASLSRAAHEWLLVFSMGKSRRSTRRAKSPS